MKIRELLSDESKWTQKNNARDKNGNIVFFKSEEACRFCLNGAILKCYGDKDYGKIRDQIFQEIAPFVSSSVHALAIVVWNDAPERTFADVKALVEKLDI